MAESVHELEGSPCSCVNSAPARLMPGPPRRLLAASAGTGQTGLQALHAVFACLLFGLTVAAAGLCIGRLTAGCIAHALVERHRRQNAKLAQSSQPSSWDEASLHRLLASAARWLPVSGSAMLCAALHVAEGTWTMQRLRTVGAAVAMAPLGALLRWHWSYMNRQGTGNSCAHSVSNLLHRHAPAHVGCNLKAQWLGMQIG